MGRSVQYTEAEYWEKDSVLPGWLNRDLVAHLAGADGAAAALVGGDPAVEIDEYRKSLNGAAFTVDGFNAVVVGRRRRESVTDVATEWGHDADLLLARCSELSDDDWAARRVPWLGGDLRVPYLLQSGSWNGGCTAGTSAGADLAPRRGHPDLLRERPRRPDDPVRAFAAGALVPGRASAWIWRAPEVDAGTTASLPRDAAGSRPDTVVEGRVSFAMVAAAIPAEYLTTGGLLLGGDLALGRIVLDHLRLDAA